MIDFIVANYVYFLIGFAALVLIIIGFIAEKTDFGRKKKNKKENPEKEEKQVVIESKVIEKPKAVLEDTKKEEVKAITEATPIIQYEIKKEEVIPTIEIKEEDVSLATEDKGKEELSFGDLDNGYDELEKIVDIDSKDEASDFEIVNPKGNDELNSVADKTIEKDENKEGPVLNLSQEEVKVEGVVQDTEDKDDIPPEEDISIINETKTEEEPKEEMVSENNETEDYYVKGLPEIKEAESIKPELSKFELPSIGEPEKVKQIEEVDDSEDIWKF